MKRYGSEEIKRNLAVRGKLTIAQGTVAQPSIAFVDDQTTGLYIESADAIGVATKGGESGILGRNGWRCNGPMEAEGFYTTGGGNLYYNPVAGFHVLSSPQGVALEATQGNIHQIASGTIQFHADSTNAQIASPTMTMGASGIKVADKVEAAGFYLTPGASAVGWDLSESTIEVHLPSAAAQTPYFLVNFVPQGFIVADVVLATTSGFASFGFYTQAPGEFHTPRGVGIAGTGQDGNSLGEFYVGPVMRTIAASSANVVSPGGSLTMVCLTTDNVANVRGRIRIRMQG